MQRDLTNSVAIETGTGVQTWSLNILKQSNCKVIYSSTLTS